MSKQSLPTEQGLVEYHKTLTRKSIAMEVMKAILTNHDFKKNHSQTPEAIAKFCFELADAMFEKLKDS